MEEGRRCLLFNSHFYSRENTVYTKHERSLAATVINSTLREPLPNQISLFSLILSLTSKETVKTRIPTGRAPVIRGIFFFSVEIPTVALFFE